MLNKQIAGKNGSCLDDDRSLKGSFVVFSTGITHFEVGGFRVVRLLQ